jgi:hypothetical protein
MHPSNVMQFLLVTSEFTFITCIKYTQFTVSVTVSQFVCTLNNEQQTVLHGQW